MNNLQDAINNDFIIDDIDRESLNELINISKLYIKTQIKKAEKKNG